ncbi:MAG TPA: D-alanyl-D-alanine carboxypeptidase [Blastocatellia bacterium]|nr:D-alanyl-D-alanine carboxypeptidase [Blastocatellia bacterium]
MKKLGFLSIIVFCLSLQVTAQVVNTSVSSSAATSKDDIIKNYFTELEEYRFKPDRQSFIFQTLDGEVLLEHNADRASDPASVIKAATTLTAVAKLGPDYRFVTRFSTNGKIDPQTKILKGDLIVTGSADPSFYSENAFHVAELLNQLGITKVEGDLIVNEDFYLNFNPYPLPSGENFKAFINPKAWDTAIKRDWDHYQSQMAQPSSAPFVGVEITGKVRLGSDAGTNLLLASESNTLSNILKEQNKYSNNVMAEMVGHKLGGLQVIERYLVDDLKLNPANVHIGSASGLYYSYLTPRDTVKIIRKLKDTLEAHHLKLEDVFPIQGRDAGTLSDRLAQEASGTLVGKTGTLTQSGVSALTGIIYTKSKGPILFAVFNQGGNVHTFRKTQDDFIASIVDFYGGAAPIAYMPTSNGVASRTR